jgi:flagellar hook-associated protein 1 FlgK
MSNYFNGINIGYKALMAQKTALDIIGHNVSNANTEGYSRQRAVLTASTPHPMPGLYTPAGAGQIGAGVDVGQIERIKNEFLESQIRGESQDRGYWTKRNEGMLRIESTFNEPSDSSLNYALGVFWQSLQDLGSNPEDSAARITVRERAQVLVDTFHILYSQLDDYQQSLNSDINTLVDRVNSIARRIADLNKQIVSVKSSGMQPNDLLDKRDLLFNELNQLVDVQGQLDSRGNLHVSIGGVGVVAATQVFELTTKVSSNENKYQDKIIFAETGEEVNISSGELAGIMHIRDEKIEEYKERLNNIAEGLLDRFNEVHRLGYDAYGEQGKNFFEIIPGYENAAEGISLSKAIENDYDNIAAGSYSDQPQVVLIENVSGDPNALYSVTVSKGTGGKDFDYILEDENGVVIASGSANRMEEIDLSASEGIKLYLQSHGEANINLLGNPGSGTNAFALGDTLKKDKVIDNASIMDYYEATISAIGVEGQRAGKMVYNQEVLLTQLENQKASFSGVSLDEEMANLIKYHQAYNAAARIITTTDRLLEALINVVR